MSDSSKKTPSPDVEHRAIECDVDSVVLGAQIAEADIIDAFKVFGLPRNFSFDRSGIQRRYYQLSRDRHPDRVAAEGAEAQARAAQEMSRLNFAYEVLSDPKKTRHHLLELEGLREEDAAPGKGGIPLELAEVWFEIQEAVLEDPEKAGVLVKQFEEKLRAEFNRIDAKTSQLEQSYDQVKQGLRSEVLTQLQGALRTHNYLLSLERDVARLKLRLNPIGVKS